MDYRLQLIWTISANSSCAYQSYMINIVIDALNECKHVYNLVRRLVQLGEDGQLGLFVTSRSEQIIVEEFSSIPSIALNDMLAFIQDDINVYIEKKLSCRRRLTKLSADHKQEIHSTQPAECSDCQLKTI